MATMTDSSAAGNRRNSLPSPWAQVVRGGGGGESSESAGVAGNPSSPPPEEAVSVDKPPSSPLKESSAGGESSDKKKPAWNKPSNGVVEGSSAVMGASSWPALSESARAAAQKSSPSDSVKSTADGSVSVSQGPVASPSQARQGNTNAIPNSSTNSTAPVRQRSFRRGGGNRQGGFLRGAPPPPPLPTFSVPRMPHDNFRNVVPVAADSSARDARSPGGFVPESHAANGPTTQRNSSRRSNFVQHGRGDGRTNNNVGHHDQDHVNFDWNSFQGSHGRGVHGQPHRPSGRGYMRPPVQGAAPFIAPTPVGSYGNAVVYPELPPPVFYVPSLGVSYVGTPPGPPIYVNYIMQEPALSILNQIDYYFSDLNLVRDEYLRSKMDDEGWVPIALIAKFPRVQNLTSSIPLILESLRASTVVEVQGDKVRRRDEWMKWIPHTGTSMDSNAQTAAVSATDELATSLEKKASLEDEGRGSTSDPCTSPIPAQPSSEDLMLSNGEVPMP